MRNQDENALYSQKMVKRLTKQGHNMLGIIDDFKNKRLENEEKNYIKKKFLEQWSLNFRGNITSNNKP